MERNIIKIDEAGLKDDLKTLIRGTVEDTLNAMLDEEAADLCNAEKHERSEGRRNYRSGHYHRKLLTSAGEVDLSVPKLRLAPFETAIIERYSRRESSVEESLIEMYLAGVSVRRVEDVTELLWGWKHVRGRHLPEAQLGRRNDQRLGTCRDRGVRRRLPGDTRSMRGRKRKQGMLAQHKDEQHPRTPEPGDTQKDTGCGLLAETSSARI